MLFRKDHDVSTRQLIGDLLGDLQTLARQEVALARAEIREELHDIVIATAVVGAGAAALGIAGLWILVAVTRGLAYLFDWPLWAVYGGIGVLLAAGAVVLLAVGWHLIRGIKVLPKTRETLAEGRAVWTPM